MGKARRYEREPVITHGDVAPLLSCPVCGGVYGLHHEVVEVFERQEDAFAGLHVIVGPSEETGDLLAEYAPLPGAVSVDGDMMGNPSPRRNGLRIGFWCEQCNPDPDIGTSYKLNIAQHKGTTHIYWSDEQ